MKHAKVSKKGNTIFDLLYRFRFLNTRHIQKMLNYKNPRYTQKLLKKLTEKEYIKRYYCRNTYNESIKPAIYFLAPLARKFLKGFEEYDLQELDKVYNAKNLSQNFIDHCLFIADLYLHFLDKKRKDEELFFFTKAELTSFDYFPKNLPDAYIALKTKRETKRYFVDLFDPNTPPRFVRRRIREYIAYQDEELWEEGTGDNILPSILLILPSDIMKKHIRYYAKAKLENTFDFPPLFLTTRNAFKNPSNNYSNMEEVKVE